LQRPAKLAVNIVHHASPRRAWITVRGNDLVAKRGQRSGFIHRQKSPGSASSAAADARARGRRYRRLQKFPAAEFVCWFHGQFRLNLTREYAADRAIWSVTSITFLVPATTWPCRKCDSSKFSGVEDAVPFMIAMRTDLVVALWPTPDSSASCYTSIQRRIRSDAWINRPSRRELQASEGRLRQLCNVTKRHLQAVVSKHGSACGPVIVPVFKAA